jgi:hypothetical protein
MSTPWQERGTEFAGTGRWRGSVSECTWGRTSGCAGLNTAREFTRPACVIVSVSGQVVRLRTLEGLFRADFRRLAWSVVCSFDPGGGRMTTEFDESKVLVVDRWRSSIE